MNVPADHLVKLPGKMTRQRARRLLAKAHPAADLHVARAPGRRGGVLVGITGEGYCRLTAAEVRQLVAVLEHLATEDG